MDDLDCPLPAGPYRPLLRLAHRCRSPHRDQGRLRRLLDWEIVLVTEGRMWWWSESLGCGCWQGPGQAALIAPGLVHAYGCEPSEHIAIHFDLQAQIELRNPDQIVTIGDLRGRPVGDRPWWYRSPDGGRFPVIRSVDEPQRFTTRLIQLITIGATAASPPQEMRCGALLLACIADLLQPEDGAGEGDQRILDCLARIPASAAPSIPELARRCGLSSNAFRLAFRRTTGETPHRHFERRRIDAAIELLRESDLTIAEVAAAVGYSDPYHFSRVVRRVSGRPPSGWR